MPELHVRNLPPELHAKLRAQAATEGRSMSAEAIALLQRALNPGRDQLATRRAAVERLREIQGRSRLSPGAPMAERLVREDRDAAR